MTTKVKQAHTPGPWTTEQHGDYLDVFPVTPGWGYGGVCRIENADIDPIPLRAQADANARLIAAAPELLEALELLHRIALQTPQLNNPDDREVIDQAWAAIRKAKGEGR